MITYRYGPWEPGDDQNPDLDRLMAIISDMIMKYDISLEQALQMAIDGNVNLFLKQGGMGDLVQGFLDNIRRQADALLKKYDIARASENLERNFKITTDKFLKNSGSGPEVRDSLRKMIETRNQDALRRFSWEQSKDQGLQKNISDIIEALDLLGRLQGAGHQFTGKEVPGPVEAGAIIDKLDELNVLASALQEALDKGDLYNLSLEKIAKYLGAESYQEFLETREAIFEKLKKLLEEKGMIQQSGDGDGGMELTPSSVRKIGRNALASIFSAMKNDDGNGTHRTREHGESENITSAVRPFEFGDNLAHIDYPGSIINSIIAGKGSRPGLENLDVHKSVGTARSSTVILLDMSGSMFRYNRFYNAKKVCLAIDALMREEYRDDKLVIIGFGSTAEIIPVGKLPSLQPHPVTIYDPHIRLVFDFNRMDARKIKENVPLYFTNLQKGLASARQALSSKQTANKNIILITDGVPTAHFDRNMLHLNYPPAPANFESALQEARKCRDDNIVINTFLLTSDWEDFFVGDEKFIQKFARISAGRFFYPHPSELDKMVLFDFIENKKRQFSI